MDCESTLRSTYPPFLKKLDTDPESACLEFLTCVYPLLIARPPAVFSRLDESRRSFLNDQILDHFIGETQRERNFPTLRKFRDQGKPFLYWLRTVIANKAKTLVKVQNKARNRTVPLVPDILKPEDNDDTGQDPVFPSEEDLRRKNERVFRQCLEGLVEHCRLALIARYYDRRNNFEIADILGLPKRGDKRNKTAGDRLRTCRKKLERCLKEHGYDRSLGAFETGSP